MTGRLVIAAGAALATALGVSAQERPPAATFRYERQVVVSTPGPQRLDLDAVVLAGAQRLAMDIPLADRHLVRNGPADFRLYTQAGVEVPYLFVPPPSDDVRVVIGSVKPIAATEKTSGFEVDLREILPGVHTVALEGVRPPFLKRFRLEGSGDRARWTVLVAEGTAFNLPSEGLRYVRIPFDAGAYRYLRVTWDDTNSGRVNVPDTAGAFYSTGVATVGPAMRVPLTVERLAAEPRRSRFHLTLPGGGLPIDALDLAIGGGMLLRNVRVLEPTFRNDPGGPQVEPSVIGEATLKRVVQEGATAEALRVVIRTPHEPELDLVFDDGDNPPVDLQGASAVLAELPWIYFDSQPGTLVARFGDPKAKAPRYDLEAAREQIPAAQSLASWGPEATRTADALPTPGLSMPNRGAALTLDNFTVVREIPSGDAGLVVVPIDAAAFAHSRSMSGAFRDIRVLDADGFQVPYLLERRDAPLTVAVRLDRREPLATGGSGPQSSVYTVRLPFPEMRQSELVLTTRARVFRRTVRIGVLSPPDRQGRAVFLPMDSRAWGQSDEASVAPPLKLAVPVPGAGEVVLEIDEGDNQPLPIETAALFLPSYAVRFYRNGGAPLLLAYGRSDLEPPQYDLSLLAGQVLGQRAVQVEAGPERGPHGIAAGGAGTGSGSPISRTVFWGALGLAVVVLLGIVARLVRRET